MMHLAAIVTELTVDQLPLGNTLPANYALTSLVVS